MSDAELKLGATYDSEPLPSARRWIVRQQIGDHGDRRGATGEDILRLGERDAAIRDLKQRLRDLENALQAQRSETKQLRTQKYSVRTHVVKQGDTLQSLARDYYGDPNQWKKIYNANGDKIDRGLPRVGEKLVIP